MPTISVQKRKQRENKRVRVYIYTFSAISFILGFLEGIQEATPYTLLVHLSLGLFFLFLVPLSYKRPVWSVLFCGLLQAAVWMFLMPSGDGPSWLGIKIPALILSVVALRIAIAEKSHQSLVTEKAKNQ